MKFKTNQNEQDKGVNKMSENVYQKFTDLIQLENDKLSLILSAKIYFEQRGLMDYVKFFKFIFDRCFKTRLCLIEQFVKTTNICPESINPEIKLEFDDYIVPFKLLAEMEDKFETIVSDLIDAAQEEKDWINFNYFLNKLDSNHICCKALAAVENKNNISALCEQHIWEK